MLNINTMAEVEKLSFKMSKQMAPIGINNGRIPSRQLSNFGCFLTNNLLR